jgi:hypothetical protein
VLDVATAVAEAKGEVERGDRGDREDHSARRHLVRSCNGRATRAADGCDSSNGAPSTSFGGRSSCEVSRSVALSWSEPGAFRSIPAASGRGDGCSACKYRRPGWGSVRQ